nr:hypothetical protein Q903MT_gene6301 [Picea sitchensis]
MSPQVKHIHLSELCYGHLISCAFNSSSCIYITEKHLLPKLNMMKLGAHKLIYLHM